VSDTKVDETRTLMAEWTILESYYILDETVSALQTHATISPCLSAVAHVREVRWEGRIAAYAGCV